MKFFTCDNNNNTHRNAKLAAIGMTLLFVSALVYVSDPVQFIVEWQLSLQPGTLLHHLWVSPPVEVFIKVYMFNYTNVDEFMSGRASKLKVEEVGPYVYQEHLENYNVTYNANGTMSFAPRRTYQFVRERSVGDPNLDYITGPNIPYMGLSTAAAEMSIVGAIALGALTRRLNSQPMLNVTVHEYLWGYEDHLVHLASKFLPSVIDFQSFGILERMFNEGDNVVTLKLPQKHQKHTEKRNDDETEHQSNDIGDYSIDNWNGVHGLKKWNFKDNSENSTFCNKLRGAYDGTLFPRNIQEGDTLYIYRTTFCRPLPIRYSKPVVFDGIDGFEFKLDEQTFDSSISDPNTNCFCKSNKCLKRGLAPVTPCYYNIPLAISFPHFHNGDPSLLESFEGLAPNAEKHDSRVIIQPQLGVPMHVHTRFQANQVVGGVKFNRALSHYQHMTLPILWVDVNIERLPEIILLLLKLLFKVLPFIQWTVIISSALAGVALLLYDCTALLCCFWHGSPMESKTEEVSRKILPMLPLLNQTKSGVPDDYYKEELQILTKQPCPV